MIKQDEKDLKNEEQIITNRLTVKTTGVVVTQHGHKFYLTKVKIKDFMENIKFTVDEWTLSKVNRIKDQGYQRKLLDKHSGEFATFISNPLNFSPTSIYVNVRPDQKNACKIEEYDNDTVDIVFEPRILLYVVDGQHRLMGMKNMMDWTLDPDIEIPFTLTHGLTRDEELEQFITMNKTQANVKTDLAEMTVSDMASSDEEYLTQLANKGNVIYRDIEYLQIAVKVMRKMYHNKDSVWYGRILMPNQSKEKGSSIGVSTKSFTDSLKDLVQKHHEGTKKNVLPTPLADITPVDIATHLTNFWDGLSKVNKEMFKPQNVCKYAIQQTIGTMVMHKVLLKIHRNAANSDDILELSSQKWKALLDVDKLNNPLKWDREYDDKPYRKQMDIEGTGPTGGYFTRQGTNQKSFGLMANEIFGQIARDPEWKKYKRKMK